jgi:hypothetical protein
MDADLAAFFRAHAELPPGSHPPPAEPPDAAAKSFSGDYWPARDGFLHHPESLIDDLVPDRGSFNEELRGLLSGSGEPAGATVDHLATYLPWHSYGDRWGIVIHFQPFVREMFRLTAHASRLAGQAVEVGVVMRDLATVLMRHELFHLEVELMATHLEALHGRALYWEFSGSRSQRPNPWTTGVLEELLATWHETEVTFSLPEIAEAWFESLEVTPPGYRDWARADDLRERLLMLDRLASDVLGAPITTGPWIVPADDELASVPRRASSDAPEWFFDEIFGRPRVAPIPVAEFVSWVRRHGEAAGVEILNGGKHHKLKIPGRGSSPFSSSKRSGGKIIPHHELRSLARLLGFASASQLREAVTADAPPAFMVAPN